jgi:hypothetical protein
METIFKIALPCALILGYTFMVLFWDVQQLLGVANWGIALGPLMFAYLCTLHSWHEMHEGGNWETPLRLTYGALGMLYLPTIIHQASTLPIMASIGPHRFIISGVVILGCILVREILWSQQIDQIHERM